MKQIAILGFGVVGGGIPELIESRMEFIKRTVGDEVAVKYILDLRDFPDSPYGGLVVHDIKVILDDPEVKLVCETMGGAHPAFDFSLACLNAGKSVVTSNKEVVANFGDVLLEAAQKNGVDYLFEASVGGGIPCIRPFFTSLAAEKITDVCGIVNGTTNYILTRMGMEEIGFDQVLAEAQKLGYAERNPAADVDGIDAKRKIIILSALAFGKLAEEKNVEAVSLRGITTDDINGAATFGGKIKYLAEATCDGERLSMSVEPVVVLDSSPLYSVDGVYNAISVTFENSGDIMYRGRGAGRLPTAGAVLEDIVASLSGAAAHEYKPEFRKADDLHSFDRKNEYYVRVRATADEVETKLGLRPDWFEYRDGVLQFVIKNAEKPALESLGAEAIYRVKR